MIECEWCGDETDTVMFVKRRAVCVLCGDHKIITTKEYYSDIAFLLFDINTAIYKLKDMKKYGIDYAHNGYRLTVIGDHIDLWEGEILEDVLVCYKNGVIYVRDGDVYNLRKFRDMVFECMFEVLSK